jgi:DNA mismatch repair protein MutS
MGASDDLVGGQSTFMMEMAQTQFALAEATQHSLLIFDEIGRGTSTYDGMALAQAIIEYVETNIQCITLFSTHYHELTQLDHLLPNLLNLHASVEEKDQTITFLYEMKPGSMERSYGVHVATLAGLPTTVTKRASELLHQFEQSPKRQVTLEKTRIKEPSIIEKELRELDPLTLSPLAALQYIIELKKKVK